MSSKVMPFYEQHDQGIELFMSIHYPEEVSRIPLRENLKTEINVFISSISMSDRAKHTESTYLSAG